MSPILVKTEEAVVAFATSASIAAGYTPGTNVFIYAGIDSEDLSAPAIICQATDAPEDFPFSGIYHCTTNVMVKQMAADTSGSVGTLPVNIFKAFLVDDIENRLTAIVSNYFVYQLLVKDTSNTTSGDAWSQQYQFDIVCGLT